MLRLPITIRVQRFHDCPLLAIEIAYCADRPKTIRIKTIVRNNNVRLLGKDLLRLFQAPGSADSHGIEAFGLRPPLQPRGQLSRPHRCFSSGSAPASSGASCAA